MARRMDLRKEIGKQARERIEVMKDNFSEVRERAEDFIAENPWKSLGIAAAAGALLAAVTLSRNHERRPWKRLLRDYL